MCILKKSWLGLYVFIFILSRLELTYRVYKVLLGLLIGIPAVAILVLLCGDCFNNRLCSKGGKYGINERGVLPSDLIVRVNRIIFKFSYYNPRFKVI